MTAGYSAPGGDEVVVIVTAGYSTPGPSVSYIGQ